MIRIIQHVSVSQDANQGDAGVVMDLFLHQGGGVKHIEMRNPSMERRGEFLVIRGADEQGVTVVNIAVADGEMGKG